MTRHSSRERDSTFGQAMFKLRTSIGLTQAGLAERLRVSRRAVGEWEAGLNSPKAEHFQYFLELCVRASVFAPEREEEEIRALWKTAHQRVLLNLSTRNAMYRFGKKSTRWRAVFPGNFVPMLTCEGKCIV
jgi:transcriptional regulator with XRE-family HTH domain